MNHDSSASPAPLELSESGRLRRQAIEELACRAARSRRRRRQAVRSAIILSVCLPFAIGAWLWREVGETESVLPSLGDGIATRRLESTALVTRALADVEVKIVGTEPDLLARWSVGSEVKAVEVLPDDELFQILAARGITAGWGTIGTERLVVFHRTKQTSRGP